MKDGEKNDGRVGWKEGKKGKGLIGGKKKRRRARSVFSRD